MAILKRTLLFCDSPKCKKSFGGPSGGLGELDVDSLILESVDMGWFRLSTDRGDLYFDSLLCLTRWNRQWGKQYWEFFERNERENGV